MGTVLEIFACLLLLTMCIGIMGLLGWMLAKPFRIKDLRLTQTIDGHLWSLF